MKHLFFARHGESHINTSNKWASHDPGSESDLGLTDAGRQQALEAGKKARRAGFTCDLIVTSPLKRASETATLIAEQIGYAPDRIEQLDLLKELHYGELEGTPTDTFWETYTYADLHLFKDAETIEVLQKRAEAALEWVKNRPEDKILVVAHSAFGRAFRRAVKGLPYTNEFKNGEVIPHAEIIQLI